MKWALWRQEKIELLRQAGIQEPSMELRAILTAVSDKRRAIFPFIQSDEIESLFPEEERKRLEDIIERRCAREPLAYILGVADFYRDRFFVGPGVLVPRSDSEVLTEASLYVLGIDISFLCQRFEDFSDLKISSDRSSLRIYDLCTGSGCIGISIANILSSYLIEYDVIMTDVSEEAIAYARRNIADVAGEPERLHTVVCDLYPDVEVVKKIWGGEKSDLIVANPPYISSNEMPELMPEVGQYEPDMALRAGDDGLDLFRRILDRAADHLAGNGVLLVEHGCDQRSAVEALFKKYGFVSIRCLRDFGGCDRVTVGRLSTVR